MKHKLQQHTQKWAALIPGWIFLLAGATVIAGCLIMPAWTDYQQIRWQKKILQKQVKSLTRQQHTYQQINEALASHDPILLQQLALSELSLLPPNTQPLPPVGSFLYPQHADGWFLTTTPKSFYESVLERPTPRPTPGLPPQMIRGNFRGGFPANNLPPKPVESELYRLTTGPVRQMVMLLGLLGVVAGLIATPEVRRGPRTT